MIYCYASQPHYWAHMRPIYEALPEPLRGGVFAPKQQPWGSPNARPRDGLWMVAGYSDAKSLGASRRVVLIEHGAGQHYPGDPRSAGHGAYSGGRDLDHVVMFICPSVEVAARWTDTYPAADAIAVGCPRLDAWFTRARVRDREVRPHAAATVAFTFHHDRAICPEAQWALPHYRGVLKATIQELRGVGAIPLGHGHPRATVPLRRLWDELGVEWIPDADEVFQRADLLVADNTSLAFEAMSIGIPVCWLDAPWYRVEVEHGLRFWRDADSGVRVTRPGNLFEGICLALTDPPEVRRRRAETIARVYAFTDGQAAARAAEAIAAIA